MSVIVSNTTPINYLVLIDHIAVLPQLYTHVIIPQAVLEELQDEGTPAKVKAWVASHPAWLEVRTVAVLLDTSLTVLDAGEREAICLAQGLAQAYERLQHTTFRAHPDLYSAFLDMYSQR